jgi:hypothetical protein
MGIDETGEIWQDIQPIGKARNADLSIATGVSGWR